jgi:uncharacterized ion transporter superfamily protein YfcC
LHVKQKIISGPLVILMVVIILAAIATWLLPAGQYNKLSATDNSFVLTTPSGDIVLPLTQKNIRQSRYYYSCSKIY